MSEQISEQISALLDGELPEAELTLLLRQIEKQPSVLDHAYRVQQAHICNQGDTPISLTDTLHFSQGIRSAIREEEIEFPQSVVNSNIALGLASFGQNEQAQPGSSNIESGQVASNDSHWRPFIGAGVAAAVALVAINAWQYQTPSQSPNNLQPSVLEADTTIVPSLDIVAPRQVPSSLSSTDVQEVNSSYTVPNFDNLNIDTPFAFRNDFRQVSYADYLLQNNIAPQSTSKNLTRIAEEQRAIIYGEFRDPQTGELIFTIEPVKR